MSEQVQSAVDKLKAIIASAASKYGSYNAAADKIVPLMQAAVMEVAHDQIALAVPGVPNPDWDPLLHPKDADGKFIEKHKGTFIYGKAKKGTFVTPAGKPNISVNLEPGEKLVKTPTGKAAKVKPSGDVKYLNDKGDEDADGGDFLKGQAAKGYLKVVDQAPGVEVDGEDEEQAKASLEKKAAAKAAEIQAKKDAQVNPLVTHPTNGAEIDIPPGAAAFQSANKVAIVNPSGTVTMHYQANTKKIEGKGSFDATVEYYENNPLFKSVGKNENTAAAAPITNSDGSISFLPPFANASAWKLAPNQQVFAHKDGDAYLLVTNDVLTAGYDVGGAWTKSDLDQGWWEEERNSPAGNYSQIAEGNYEGLPTSITGPEGEMALAPNETAWVGPVGQYIVEADGQFSYGYTYQGKNLPNDSQAYWDQVKSSGKWKIAAAGEEAPLEPTTPEADEPTAAPADAPADVAQVAAEEQAKVNSKIDAKGGDFVTADGIKVGSYNGQTMVEVPNGPEWALMPGDTLHTNGESYVIQEASGDLADAWSPDNGYGTDAPDDYLFNTEYELVDLSPAGEKAPEPEAPAAESETPDAESEVTTGAGSDNPDAADQQFQIPGGPKWGVPTGWSLQIHLPKNTTKAHFALIADDGVIYEAWSPEGGSTVPSQSWWQDNASKYVDATAMVKSIEPSETPEPVKYVLPNGTQSPWTLKDGESVWGWVKKGLGKYILVGKDGEPVAGMWDDDGSSSGVPGSPDWKNQYTQVYPEPADVEIADEPTVDPSALTPQGINYELPNGATVKVEPGQKLVGVPEHLLPEGQKSALILLGPDNKPISGYYPSGAPGPQSAVDKTFEAYKDQFIVVVDGNGTPGPQPDNDSSKGVDDDIATASVFTHPASGKNFTIPPGGALYQHKANKDNYIVLDADGNGTTIKANGDGKPSTETQLKSTTTGNYVKIKGSNVKANTSTSPAAPAVADAPQTPASPKAKKGPVLPEVTLPDGTTKTLNYGQFAFTSPLQTNKLWIATPGSHVQVYSADGSVQTLPTKYTTASMKKSGFDLLAKAPNPPTTELVLPAPSKEFNDKFSVDTAINQAQSAVSKYFGSHTWTSSNYAWDGKSTAERVAHIAALRETLLPHLADLTAASKSTTVDKSVKAAASKEKSRLMALLAASEVAQHLTDNGLDGLDWDAAQGKLAPLSTAFPNKYPFKPHTAVTAITAMHKELQFTASIEGLGFDPFNETTPSVMEQYALSKGFVAVAGVPDIDTLRQWVLADLGAPGTSLSTKNTIENEAIKKVALDKIKVNGAAYAKSAALKNAAASTPEKVLAAEETAQFKAQAKTLVTEYKVTDLSGPLMTVTLKSVPGTHSWTLNTPGETAESIVTDQQVLDGVASGKYAPLSEAPAYGQPTFKAAKADFLKEHGTLSAMAAPAKNTYIKDAGGAYVGKMGSEAKSEWILWNLTGDNLAKFAIEEKAALNSSYAGVPLTEHKHASSHPGSPLSPQGKLAYQTLADSLASNPTYGNLFFGDTWKTPAKWEPEQKIAFITDLDIKGIGFGSDATIANWVAAHPHLPSPSATITPVTGPSAGAQAPVAKPDGVSDAAWGFVQQVLAEDTFTPEQSALIGSWADPSATDLDQARYSAQIALKKNGVAEVHASLMPEATVRLLAYAREQSWNTPEDEKSFRADIVASIAHLASSGAFITGDTPVWLAPDGKQWPMTPGGSVWSKTYGSGAKEYMVVNPNGTSYSIDSSSTNTVSSYVVSNAADYGYTKILTIGEPLSLKAAKSEGVETDETTWNLADKATTNELPVGTIPTSITDYDDAQATLLLKQALDTDKSAPALAAMMSALPTQVKQLALHSTQIDDKNMLSTLNFMAKKGVFYGAGASLSDIKPGKPYAKAISLGQVSPAEISNWDSDTIKMAMDDLKVPYAQGIFTGGAEDAKALSTKLGLLLDPDSFVLPASAKSAGLPKVWNLKQIDKPLGGMHSKKTWVDQEGNEYMTKAFGSDPNSDSRVEAEHFANLIGRMHGFRQPETRLMQIEGKKTYVQHLAPSPGDLVGTNVLSLSDEQLAQVMEEHILDWLVSNHDSHPGNLMTLPNGDIMGIDKGQAFKGFPNDKLAHGFLPQGNFEKVIYDQFYAAVKNGSISKERADYVTTRVLRKAAKIAERNDAEHREMLEQALASRNTWPDQAPNKAAFIDLLMERKANLLSDFDTLYKGVYDKSSYAYDIDKDNLSVARLEDGTWLDVNQDFADSVKKSAVHGTAVMFNTQDAEDSHAVFYTEKGYDGSDILRGEMRMTKNADALLTAWLKEQSIENDNSVQVDPYAYTPPQPSHTHLAGNDQFFGSLEAYAKTVNTHAPNGGKTPDGEYNNGTLSAAKSNYEFLSKEHDKIDKWVEANPGKVYPNEVANDSNFVTQEQQTAWLNMAKTYISQFEMIDESKAQGKKVTDVFPDATPFPKIQYAPSGTLDEIKAKEAGTASPEAAVPAPADAPTWTGPEGATFTQSAGGWVDELGMTHSDSEVAAYVEAHQAEGWTFTDGNTEDILAQATQQIGTKTLKVTKRKSYGTNGTYNVENGQLEHASNNVLNHGYSGYEYDIEYTNSGGKKVVIEYHPWTEPGVTKSHQGLLRVQVDGWEGNADDIRDAMDTIRETGVDLTPADEDGLDLHYWRHMYGILQDRMDRGESKWKQTIDAIQAGWKSEPNMSPQAELALLRASWALSLGQDVVDNADTKPKFSRFRVSDSQQGTGKPHWVRPDVSVADLKEAWGSTLPAATKTNDVPFSAIVASGGLFSTEERLRVLGAFLGGMSSSADQGYGSAAFVYTRQNLTVGSATFYYMPHTALRTSNYAFNGDNYGNPEYRKTQSPFDLTKASKFSGGGNELLMKNGVSVLDDIAFMQVGEYVDDDRTKAIKNLSDQGITEIHGLTLEEYFPRTSADAKKSAKKVWDWTLAQEAAK